MEDSRSQGIKFTSNVFNINFKKFHRVNAQFKAFIDFLKEQNGVVLEGALDLMANLNDNVIFDLVDTLKTCIGQARPITGTPPPLLNLLFFQNNNWLCLVNEDFMAVTRILISPCKIYLVGPELEVSNRVIRHYNQHSSHFTRITFVDENFHQLLGDQISDQISKRVKEIFSKGIALPPHNLIPILFLGIRVAGREYHFLAFSSSQLRDHSCWFFSPVDDLTPDTIRSWMGM
jgi:RNA dependent RNA polymerase